MRRGLALTFVALTACGPAPLVVPRLHAHENVVQVEAGARYALSLTSPTDAAAIGSEWSGAAPEGSPLGFMARTPIVLKADDFGGPLDDNAAWFLETVDGLATVAGLGIITSRVEAFDEARAVYGPIREHGFELWFHGHTHPTGEATPEFMGRGLASEVASFSTGLADGRSLLGVDFRSFGAPENAFDADTAAALATAPTIVVWLFGPAVAPTFVLPRLVDLEVEPGRVYDPAELQPLFEAALSANPDAPAITLQLHPFMFAPADRARARTVLESLAADERFRFATPFDVWSWRVDRAAVSLTKTTPTDYVLDLSRAELDHRLAFPVNTPVTVQRIP